MKSNLIVLAVVAISLLFSILAFSLNVKAIKIFHSDEASVLLLESFAKDIEFGVYTNSEAAQKVKLLAGAERKLVSGAKKLEIANYIFMIAFFLISLVQFLLLKKLKLKKIKDRPQLHVQDRAHLGLTQKTHTLDE